MTGKTISDTLERYIMGDRFEMVVNGKFAKDEAASTVRLVMVDPDVVPTVMTWNYPLPLEDVEDKIGDMYVVTISPVEGPL